MTAYVAVQLSAHFPVQLFCLDNAHVVFTPTQTFKTIIDGNAVWSNEGFSIAGEEYQYGVQIPYKEIPSMVEYLQQQKLISPF